MVLPLAVSVGLNEPHTSAGEQLQITPIAVGSFDTVAANCAVFGTPCALAAMQYKLPEGQSVAGGNSPCVQAILIGRGRMVRVTLAVTEGSLVTVATSVTVFPMGT